MPLFDYTCQKCQKASEILVRDRAARPTCPACGSADLVKKPSLIARTGRGDGDGDLPGMGGCEGGGCESGGCGMPGLPGMQGGGGGGCCGGSCSGHGA